jgi:hypothetical protein
MAEKSLTEQLDGIIVAMVENTVENTNPDGTTSVGFFANSLYFAWKESGINRVLTDVECSYIAKKYAEIQGLDSNYQNNVFESVRYYIGQGKSGNLDVVLKVGIIGAVVMLLSFFMKKNKDNKVSENV